MAAVDMQRCAWWARKPMKEDLNLEAILDSVCDEASFVAFLAALSKDWENEQQKEAQHLSAPYGPGANGWEHSSIGSFLEAASACASAHLDNAGADREQGNPWHRAAEILYCGKTYE